MFDSILPVSFYNDIAVLNKAHDVYIVQHCESHKIYIKKILTVYNMDIYKTLFEQPVKNTPRIYALYENKEKKTLTVIEEYISGETLQEIINIAGLFSAKEVASYIIMLCDILTSLHSMKPPIIHRDIKPSNLALTEDDRIVLLDFNAAHTNTPSKTRDTQLIGTEEYAAPEQYGFGNSSAKTDIYAIGGLMNALLYGDPDSKKSDNPALDKIISKCLKIKPEERFKNVNQLKRALKIFLLF